MYSPVPICGISISLEEAKGCKEMMVLGGSFVRPVTQWDDHIFLDGKPGPVTCRLAELVQDDMDNDVGMTRHKTNDERGTTWRWDGNNAYDIGGHFL